MRIALVTAFRSEAAPLLGLLSIAERGKLNGVRTWRGRLGPQDVRLVVCGAGPQRAAESLNKVTDFLSGSDLAVNFGVCGALDTTARLHQVVSMETVAAVYHHDQSPVQLASMAVAGEISQQDGALVTHGNPVFDSRVAERLARRFKAGYVDMEAWEVAAFFRRMNVPIAVIKAVSDHADEASAAGFPASLRAAAAKCALAVHRSLLAL